MHLLFVNYEKEPYDKNGNRLYAEKRQDPQTKFWKPTGIVRDREGGDIVEPAYWLGKYSDMPHILSFLNESYQTISRCWRRTTKWPHCSVRSRRH